MAVTWGIGHLLETAHTDVYGEHLKNWSMDTLPIRPMQWKVLGEPKTASQFKIVKRLLIQVSELVIAMDTDCEGGDDRARADPVLSVMAAPDGPMHTQHSIFRPKNAPHTSIRSVRGAPDIAACWRPISHQTAA